MKHLLTVLAFIIISFSVQGGSHFLINVEHFASISFMRAEPIFTMGFAAMIIQGFLMSYAMSHYCSGQSTLRNGFEVSLVFGLFLASYIVLAEPAKFAAPSVTSWMTVEAIASTIQFSIFGLALGWIHRQFQP